LDKFLLWPGWFPATENREFGKRFYQKFSVNDTVTYPHGGPGYVMNWKYVERLVQESTGKSVVRGAISEDLANAVTMKYHDIFPQPSLDKSGRQLFHPEAPQVMYENPSWLARVQLGIETVQGDGCCSPFSVSYHHMQPSAMRLLEYQLYECPHRLGTV
jgi:hypothetical protein